jgi:hypothetical protein
MVSDLTLRLSVGKVHADPAPRAVLEALKRATVRVGAGTPGGFDLTFAVSPGSPLVTQLLPQGYFDPPSRVILTAVLRGVETVLMDGVITHHEMAPSNDPGKAELSVKGEDLTRMLDLVDLTGFPFPAMPAEARIMLMIAKYAPLYKIVPMVMPSVLLDVSNPLEGVASQHGTDLAYITYLADLVGYTFFIQAGPSEGMNFAYWGPLLRAAVPFLPPPPALAVGWDHHSNVESMSFSFDGFSATQWLVFVQVPGANLTVPIPVPNVNPISPALGRKQPLPLKIKKMSGMSKYSPVQAAGIALGRAAAEANKVVRGQGSLDVLRYGGILHARTLVEVRGAGVTYDGQWFVDSVTHTLTPGSYKQSFTLTRNALIAKQGSDPIGGLLGAPLDALPTSQVQQAEGFAGAAVKAADPNAALGLPGPPLPAPLPPPTPLSPPGLPSLPAPSP